MNMFENLRPWYDSSQFMMDPNITLQILFSIVAKFGFHS